ncbi:glycosyltransferase family 4 protein [Prevotella cerevisiae]|uniref:Glycosyltransferase family 4 protein n=1 Tax=Segatella cerevisiae TaxID=2053716 RepID=A0ABT1BXY8_9BACT|nr:glycosyltransferase family 4 protein [Segatella cerevisiae]MCO6025929.1 glycosyltransferase family 4 protein [Segatella cerevisiae]
MIDEINPDIILCTDFPKSQDFFFYLYRNKLVQLVHDPFPHLGEQTYRRKINRYFSHHFTKCFVMLNQSLRKAYIERYKLDPKRVHVSRLGVYECLWQLSPDHIKKNSKKQILFFGRISPYKGIEYLINAMDNVHKKLPEALLIIAGGGDLYFNKSLYEGKNYIRIVNRFLSLEELYGLLKISDITVCPYIDATQSGVIMTSYAACVPVLATRVGGLPEMIIEGKTGEVVSPKNVEELAKKIIYMIESDARLIKYKMNVEEAINNGKYSWEVISDKYLEIFRKVIKS